MKFSFQCGIILTVYAASIISHPTHYSNLKDVNCSDNPQIISYHTHVLYMLTNTDSVKNALALRDKTIDYFQRYLGPNCDGRYDNGRLCMITDHLFNVTLSDGPFPV